eukprot:6201027-Pleurochrysis_carterae.AAC.6
MRRVNSGTEGNVQRMAHAHMGQINYFKTSWTSSAPACSALLVLSRRDHVDKPRGAASGIGSEKATLRGSNLRFQKELECVAVSVACITVCTVSNFGPLAEGVNHKTAVLRLAPAMAARWPGAAAAAAPTACASPRLRAHAARGPWTYPQITVEHCCCVVLAGLSRELDAALVLVAHSVSQVCVARGA